MAPYTGAIFLYQGENFEVSPGTKSSFFKMKKLRNEQAIRSTLPTVFLLSTTGTAKAAVGSTLPARRCERQRGSAQPHVWLQDLP